MLFGLIAGVAIGYFFKPQLDKVVVKVIKMVRSAKEKVRHDDDDI